MSAEDEPGVCPHCGAKMVTYRHHLTAPLVRALAKLHAAGGGPVNIKELRLTRNQWDNFQKLRYFNLVKRTFVGGERKRGVWEQTDLGRRFITGAAQVHEIAVTYRGETEDLVGPWVYAHQVDPEYQTEWAGTPVS